MEWKVLHAYQAVLHEEKQKLDQAEQRIKQQKLKKALDEQVQKSTANNNNSLDQPYIDFVNEDVKKFHEEEERKKQ